MKPPANNTNERFSVGSVTYGTKISEIRESLNSKFGKKTIDALIDTGRLRIVRNIEEAEAIGLDIKESKKNTITGYVVPDEFAHENNPEGIFATLKLKENLKFPSGKIIVKEGYHIVYQHRGFGAKHLTGNLLEHSSRDFYRDENNKTESAMIGLKDVLKRSNELFRLSPNQFVFYSSTFKLGVPCRFEEDKQRFIVITMTPVSNRYRAWGTDSVRLSGALEFPDHAASVTAPSLVPAIEQNQNGTQPVKAHKDLYTDVDYTQEIRDELEKIDSQNNCRKSRFGKVQGFYNKSKNQAVLVAENLRALKNAKEIASSSLHIESHCDLLHENEKVQAIHIFAVPAIIEGDLFRVELTVRDYVERDHERKMVHSIDGISIQRYEKAFVWEPPAQEVASKGTLQKTGQPTNERYSSIVNENIKSIPLYRLLSGYIRADGKKYFDNVSLEEFGLDGVYQSSVRQLYVNQFLFRKFANNFKEVLEKNKFPLSTRNRQLLFLNFEIAADDFWLNSQGLTTNLQSLEKIISNQAAYQKLSPNVVAIFEATRRQIVQNSLPFQLSEQGKKILKLHVEALSTKYPSIEDASEEVVRLYKKFSELEKSGKPLPEVPKAKKTKEPER